MLTLALLSSALALDPAVSDPIDGPSGLSDLAVASGPTLVMLGDSALQLRDPRDGTLVDEVAVGGNRLLLTDLDADGSEDLLVCADDGVWAVSWDGTLGEPALLTATPCEALAAHALAGADGYATAVEAVLLWSADWSASTEAGISLDGAPLLASRGDAIAAAAVGSSGLQALGTLGLSSLATGGPVSALGVREERWSWARADEAVVYDELGSTWDLSAIAADLRWVDLDADGEAELVAAYDDEGQLAVVSGSTEEVLATEGAPTRLAVGDADGDGCEDVVALLAATAQAQVLGSSDCPSRLDEDDDGYTTYDGDCNDADDDVHPGASEACDGEDDDCDGEVDEGEIAVELEVYDFETGDEISHSPDEGTVADVVALTEGCPSSLSWDYGGEDVLVCSELDAWTQFCAFQDDGEAWISVAAFDAEGALAAEDQLSFGIENVAPEITGGDFYGGSPLGYDRTVELFVGDRWSGQLYVEEPGADQVAVEVSGAPDSFSATDEAYLSYVALEDDVGSWAVVVRVEDDDGAFDTLAFELEVYALPQDDSAQVDTGDDYDGYDCGGSGCDEDVDGGGCCCGSSSLAVVVLAGTLRRRRVTKV